MKVPEKWQSNSMQLGGVSAPNIVTGIARQGQSLTNCYGTHKFFFTSAWNTTKMTVQGEAKRHKDEESRAGSDGGRGSRWKQVEAWSCGNWGGSRCAPRNPRSLTS